MNDQKVIKNNSDLTGQDRIVRNIASSWAAQLFFVIAGFIIPRLIDDNLGRHSLGIWDFCWSIIAYFSLVKAGVISSINRYVAKFRAKEDLNGVNVAVNSVFLVLMTMSAIIILLTTLTVYFLPVLFKAKLDNHIHEAQWIIGLLGISLAVSNLQSSFGGILTGFHRWDLHHAVNGAERLITMIGMIIALSMSYGLVSLALIELMGAVLSFISRWFLAHRVFSLFTLSYKLAKWQTAKNMLAFGSKTFVPTIGGLIGNQTISLILVWYMGPGALALFARPRNLIRHLQSFVMRYALVYAPTASSIQAMSDESRIEALFVRAIRYGAHFTLPAIILLAVYGGTIIHFWMGPEYANNELVLILSLGFLPYLCNMAGVSILSGMNMHGRPGIVRCGGSICSAILCLISLNVYPSNLIAVAIALVIPICLTELYVTYYGIKVAKVTFKLFLMEAMIKPIVYVLPYTICLLMAKMLLDDLAKAFLAGLGSGSLALFAVYWRYVFPKKYRCTIYEKLGLARLAKRAG